MDLSPVRAIASSLELFGNKIMHQTVNSLGKKLVHLPRFNCHIAHSVNFKSNDSTLHNIHKLISEQVYYMKGITKMPMNIIEKKKGLKGLKVSLLD